MFDDCSARVSLIFRTASYSILFIFFNMDSEDSFNDFLGGAISDVENLRHMQFRRKQTEKRKKGPRGPRPKVLAMKLYHLPEASQVPMFGITTHGLVKQHMDQGYGMYFLRQCLDDAFCFKQLSFSSRKFLHIFLPHFKLFLVSSHSYFI